MKIAFNILMEKFETDISHVTYSYVAKFFTRRLLTPLPFVLFCISFNVEKKLPRIITLLKVVITCK